MVISCLVNIVQGGGGEVLPRFGMLENSPKTVKCVITFETDWSLLKPIEVLKYRGFFLGGWNGDWLDLFTWPSQDILHEVLPIVVTKESQMFTRVL